MRKNNEIAGALLRGDELADDDADDRERHRNLHAAKDEGERSRKPHSYENLPLRHAQGAAKPQHGCLEP